MTIPKVPTCPHGCGPLQWVDDQWFCPECGDEWGAEADGRDEVWYADGLERNPHTGEEA